MKLRYFKDSTVASLFERVPENLEIYRDPFNSVFNEAWQPTHYREIESREIGESQLNQLVLPDSENKRDVENSGLIHQIFGVITPYLAKEERLWCYYCHMGARKYSVQRWPIPDDDDAAIKEIRKRYFPRGARGFERDNPLARLWWMGYIASLATDLDFDTALKAFLYKADVRANLLERPGVGISPNVINAFIRLIDREIGRGDEGVWFFKSYRGSAGGRKEAYRALMIKLNMLGGQVLLDTLPKEEIWTMLCAIYDELKLDYSQNSE